MSAHIYVQQGELLADSADNDEHGGPPAVSRESDDRESDIRETDIRETSIREHHDVESPVIASADAAPYDPSDHDAERARMLRAAGIDVVTMLRHAALTTMRAMSSDDLEHALRGAEQAYKLAGAYSGRDGSGKSGKVEVKVNIASFAHPRQ